MIVETKRYQFGNYRDFLEQKVSEFLKQIPIISLYKDDRVEQREDYVIQEKRIALYLNGHKLISTMSLPQEQDAYAVGFLMSEGVIETLGDIQSIEVSDDGLNVYVQSRINQDNLDNLFNEKTLTSGCCVGVSANFEGKIVEKFISTPLSLPPQRLWALVEKFSSSTDLFDKTGCVHKATLVFENDYELTSEDVGRHNAVDKVMGKARLQNLDTTYAILLVSGRLSMEMVIKAAMHDIAIVISKSATTELGIKSAQLLGITLVGFARDKRCNIYTHPQRIRDSKLTSDIAEI
ncbi:formate dehydrogenase accessory sulfurtransferase FdhD [uncultured Helicobacter sp.]|uniref:formate dehydrogenase accessory sulfurtransferase FdhD n=1 Tax=uncultured Helicobacter sp. TaxID=175537 RepID=UPI00374F8CE5